MKGRALAKVGGVMMVALGGLVPFKAEALPFEMSPEGFTEYINTGKARWEDNSVNTVSNARNCYDIVGNGESYYCDVDLESKTLLGIQRCINKTVGIGVSRGGYLVSASDTASTKCSDWEKVSATPDLPAPTPQETSQQQPTPSADDAGLTRTQVLVGGVFLLSLGVAIGGAVGLTSRKRD